MIKKKLDDCMRFAEALPGCTALVSGEIANPESEEIHWTYDQVEIQHGGDSVTIYGRDDITALRDFLAAYLEELDKRDATGEEPIPQDAKVGALSEEEIATLSASDPVQKMSKVERNPGKYGEGEIVL